MESDAGPISVVYNSLRRIKRALNLAIGLTGILVQGPGSKDRAESFEASLIKLRPLAPGRRPAVQDKPHAGPESF